MRTKPFFILPLLLSADIALADSFTATGSLNLTIGTTGVSGTAGLLYSDGSLLQSLPGTFYATDPNMPSNGGPVFALGNDQSLRLTTDKSYATAPLTIINTNTSGGTGNLFEIYNSLGGYNAVVYFDDGGDFFSRLAMLVSGHVSGSSPHQSIVAPNAYMPFMYGCWSDVTGPCYVARNNYGVAGEYSFLGMTAAGAATIALDAQNTQVVFGNQTISGSGQVFTGNAFFGSVGAANLRFGGADAASPVSQTISFQNVLAGTSNTAGVDAYFLASAGTGTGAGGKFHFQTALAGSSGTSQNSLADALVIDGTTGVTVYNGGNNTAQLAFAANSGVGTAFGSVNGGGGLILFQNSSGITGSWTQQIGFNSSGVTVINDSGYSFSSSASSVTGTNWSALWQCASASSTNPCVTVGKGTSRQDASGTLQLATVITGALTYSTLPSSPTAGQRAFISDGNTSTYGATVSSGGGSTKISVLYNGSNWVVD